jgi:hypothetical protein
MPCIKEVHTCAGIVFKVFKFRAIAYGAVLRRSLEGPKGVEEIRGRLEHTRGGSTSTSPTSGAA